MATRLRREGDDFFSVFAKAAWAEAKAVAAAVDRTSVVTNSRRVQQFDFSLLCARFAEVDFIGIAATLIALRARVNLWLRFPAVPEQPEEHKPQQRRPSENG